MNQVTLASLSNRESWTESFQALDENGDAIDLSAATVVVELRDPDNRTNTAATVSVSGTTFTASLTIAQTRALSIREYDIGCTIEIDSFVTQFFVGTIPIVDGVVS